MIIKMLKPFGLAVKGEILRDVNKPIAEQLIRRGIAKAVVEKKKKHDSNR